MFKHVSFDRGRRALLGAGGALFLAAALQPAGALAQSGAGAKKKIGIIGSGNIGGTIGGMWVKAGHPVHVLVAPSRKSLKDLVAGLGPLAQRGHGRAGDRLRRRYFHRRAVWRTAADRQGQCRGAEGQDRARCLQCRPHPRRRDRRGGRARRCRRRSRRNFCPARGWCVPSTRSAISIFAREADRPDPKLAMPIAGDDAEAVQVAGALVRDAGFDPVVVGKLADARRFQRGAPGYGQNGDGGRTQAEALTGAMTMLQRWVRARDAGDAARARGGAVVVRLFLLAARRLLRAAAAARPDGHRRRRAEPAVAVHRHFRRRCSSRSRSTAHWSRKLPRARFIPIVYHFFVANLALFWLLLTLGVGDGDRGAGVLRLGQRVQPVRGRGVLVVHGRPVHRRAGQAAVRLHRRRRHGRRAAGSGRSRSACRCRSARSTC